MNDLVKRILEVTGRTPEELVAVIDGKDNWGALVHSFEYLTVLGCVSDAIRKEYLQ